MEGHTMSKAKLLIYKGSTRRYMAVDLLPGETQMQASRRILCKLGEGYCVDNGVNKIKMLNDKIIKIC
jgi:hypothetical protein